MRQQKQLKLSRRKQGEKRKSHPWIRPMALPAKPPEDHHMTARKEKKRGKKTVKPKPNFSGWNPTAWAAMRRSHVLPSEPQPDTGASTL
ncbi:hypothetical protein HL42_1842 [Trichophyton rubrum]|nr:hypothetical protein HL42_1842 [Trichophyton rubrum]